MGKTRLLITALGMLAALGSIEACQKKSPAPAPAATATPAESTASAPAVAVTATPAELRGEQAFLAYCAMCHGADGSGDGNLSGQLRGAGAMVAHLDDAARIAKLGRDGVKNVIVKGGAHTGRSNLMPAWGEELEPGLIEDITSFVMTLPERKQGVPSSTIDKYLEAPAGISSEGRRLFVFNCSGCHGAYGKGDGFNGEVLRVKRHIRPRDLTDSTYFSRKSDQELFTTISLGGGHTGKSPFMPAWTVTLKPAQIKDLVSYIREISHTSAQP